MSNYERYEDYMQLINTTTTAQEPVQSLVTIDAILQAYNIEEPLIQCAIRALLKTGQSLSEEDKRDAMASIKLSIELEK